jgi:hypothetical protein
MYYRRALENGEVSQECVGIQYKYHPVLGQHFYELPSSISLFTMTNFKVAPCRVAISMFL